MLIGSNVKIIHPHNMRFGRHVWIKDDVSLIAHGEMNIGNSVVIGERTTVWSEQQGVSIGDNTGVGKGCYLAQLGGKLEIGRECLLADHIHVYTASHRYMNAKKPILDQGYESYSIVIEDDVWIGTGVTIVGNVHIGKGAVIGAHSFVHQNIPKNAIVAGIPARVMKYRT
jgi:acetyltransferase-like isoleucine patch superfamily enzyme